MDWPVVANMRSTLRAASEALWRFGRRGKRSVWPGAPSVKLLLLIGAGVVAAPFALTYLLHSPWWGHADGACKDNELGCGLSIHVVGTAMVGFLGYYLLVLRCEARAANWWRRRVRRGPQELFPWAPPLDSLVHPTPRPPVRRSPAALGIVSNGEPLRSGRAQPVTKAMVSRASFVEEIASDLDDDTGPQILVGRTGSGKTLVLMALAEHLARRGQVPVAITLRGAETIDFQEAARAVYGQTLRARDAADADKHWHWLRQRGLITVLADELDKARADAGEVSRAIDLARRQDLRLVIAARPDGMSGAKGGRRIELEQLDHGAVIEHLAAARPTASADDLDRLIGDYGLVDQPYYLWLTRELLGVDGLPKRNLEVDGESASRTGARPDDARCALLQAYREAIEAGALRVEAGVAADDRKMVLRKLEIVAYVRLRNHKTVDEIAREIAQTTVVPDWSGDGQVDDLGTRPAIDGGRRLRVLTVSPDDEVNFAHPTTASYFAACFLARQVDNDDVWNDFLDLPMTAAVALTVVLAATKVQDRRRLGLVIERLLSGDAGNDGPDAGIGAGGEHLSRLSVAVEVMWRGRLDDEAAALRVLDAARPDRLTGAGLTPDKRRLLEHLARLPVPGVSSTLWDFATSKSEEYAVRRHAVRLLTAGEPPPLARIRELLEPIKENLQAARAQADANGPQPDDRGTEFDRLRAVAWILPSLRTAVDGADLELSDELGSCQADLVGLARGEHRMTEQRGLEASIAQGLKLDAVRQPRGAPDPLALELLREPASEVFWFTRLLALQAVTIRSVENQDTTAVADLADAIGTNDGEHPFVRECARLCASAMRADDWRPYVWDDMATVAAGHWHGLSRDATRLIGDLIVLLNLNERSDVKARDRFGHENRLPFCLSDSPDRRELYGHGASPSTCPLKKSDQAHACLCPYSVDYHEDGARRELSRAFCRHQRLAAGHGVPWQPRLGRSALQAFWERMEDLARF